MRIRNSSPIVNSVSAASTSSSSSSSLHSWTTIYSIASSTDSSSSSSPWNYTPSPSCSNRCEGLDLLVKAIHHVCAGSVVGVPYIQRRVIRRRRRAQRFSKFVVTDSNPMLKEKEEEKEEPNSARRRQRRVMALPSKYQDSVLDLWKPRIRRPRSVNAVDGSSQ